MVVDPAIDTKPASGLLVTKLIVDGVTVKELTLAYREPPPVFANI